MDALLVVRDRFVPLLSTADTRSLRTTDKTMNRLVNWGVKTLDLSSCPSGDRAIKDPDARFPNCTKLVWDMRDTKDSSLLRHLAGFPKFVAGLREIDLKGIAHPHPHVLCADLSTALDHCSPRMQRLAIEVEGVFSCELIPKPAWGAVPANWSKAVAAGIMDLSTLWNEADRNGACLRKLSISRLHPELATPSSMMAHAMLHLSDLEIKCRDDDLGVCSPVFWQQLALATPSLRTLSLQTIPSRKQCFNVPLTFALFTGLRCLRILAKEIRDEFNLFPLTQLHSLDLTPSDMARTPELSAFTCLTHLSLAAKGADDWPIDFEPLSRNLRSLDMTNCRDAPSSLPDGLTALTLCFAPHTSNLTSKHLLRFMATVSPRTIRHLHLSDTMFPSTFLRYLAGGLSGLASLVLKRVSFILPRTSATIELPDLHTLVFASDEGTTHLADSLVSTLRLPAARKVHMLCTMSLDAYDAMPRSFAPQATDVIVQRLRIDDDMLIAACAKYPDVGILDRIGSEVKVVDVSGTTDDGVHLAAATEGERLHALDLMPGESGTTSLQTRPDLSEASLVTLVEYCPQMTRLVFASQSPVDGACLPGIASGMSMLRRLELWSCSNVRSDHLESLAVACTSLTRLVLNGMDGVGQAGYSALRGMQPTLKHLGVLGVGKYTSDQWRFDCLVDVLCAEGAGLEVAVLEWDKLGNDVHLLSVCASAGLEIEWVVWKN